MSDSFEHECLRLRSRIARLRRRADRHLYQAFVAGRLFDSLPVTLRSGASKWHWTLRIARYLAARGHGSASDDRLLADGEQLLRDALAGARWLSQTIQQRWQNTPADPTATAEEVSND